FVQSRRVIQERDNAVVQAHKARRINAFLQQMLASADPDTGRGRDVTVVSVLGAASRQIETEFNDQPEIEASLRETIGRTYTSLGDYEPAERHLQRALDIRRRVLADDDASIGAL